MAKDVISVNGQETVVPETEAKAFRGVNWAILSIGGFVLIAVILFVVFFSKAASDGEVKSPASIANSN